MQACEGHREESYEPPSTLSLAKLEELPSNESNACAKSGGLVGLGGKRLPLCPRHAPGTMVSEDKVSGGRPGWP